jgi:DNA-binding MarR family transcriptional regulator
MSVEESRRTESRVEVGETLQQVGLLLIRYLADRQGLAFTSVLTLTILDSEGPTRLTALATAEGVSQPSMSQLVQRLERQGLVVRLSDPDDGRAALIDITDAGRELIAERQRALRARLAGLLTALSAEDEAALTLAMHVTQPIIGRMIRSAAQAGLPGEEAAPGPEHDANTNTNSTL